MPLEISQAEPSRLQLLASVLGRAFVTEPMMTWPLGPGDDLESRCVRAFEYFLESLVELGMVWETEGGLGAAVWVPPNQHEAWERAQRNESRVHALTDDGGARFDEFWSWIASNVPDEPLWHLDSVGVDPAAQGRGIGSALVRFGLDRAREQGDGVFLETGSPRNVPLYEHLGFRTVAEADAPSGGPHVWFLRWDP